MTGRLSIMRAPGVSLIEMLLFIIIIGVGAVALLRSFSSLLPRSPTGAQITQASQIAQERIELILGRYAAAGFAAVNDPCVGGTPPAICTALPAGYAVAVTGVSSADPWNGNPVTAYKLVKVTVSFEGQQLAEERTVLTNY